MGAQPHETAWVLGGLVAGFILSIIALLCLFGGYILGLALLLPIILATPVIVLAALGSAVVGLARRRSHKAAPYVSRARLMIAGPVAVRLVEMEGSCAAKIQYSVGDEFTFENSTRVTPAMCGPAMHGLQPYLEKFRTGEDGHVATVQCPLPGSILVFNLREKVPNLR